MYKHGPYRMYEVNSGSLRFQVRLPAGFGVVNIGLNARDDPNTELYKITIPVNLSCIFTDNTRNDKEKTQHFRLPTSFTPSYKSLWLSWYNNKICLGDDNDPKPFFTYQDPNIRKNNIGFVKFYLASASWPVDYIYDGSPVILKEQQNVKIQNGNLKWKKMVEGKLPPDALIGGFEDEPIYIARAKHRGSLCPGKYVASKERAYVAWGGQEHEKTDFEILCGYNAKWVNTTGRNIPENAFKAGTSEVNQETMYIGRAMVDNNLICGKVHVHYATCYLPYRKEVEVSAYQILVTDES